MTSADSFNILGWMLSGPGDFDAFKDFNAISTNSSVTLMSVALILVPVRQTKPQNSPFLSHVSDAAWSRPILDRPVCRLQLSFSDRI